MTSYLPRDIWFPLVRPLVLRGTQNGVVKRASGTAHLHTIPPDPENERPHAQPASSSSDRTGRVPESNEKTVVFHCYHTESVVEVICHLSGERLLSRIRTAIKPVFKIAHQAGNVGRGRITIKSCEIILYRVQISVRQITRTSHTTNRWDERPPIIAQRVEK